MLNNPISFATMGHTSSSIFRNIALHTKHTQDFFKKATRYDMYGGDIFRNLLHLIYGCSYHSTDVDSVYNMHGSGDWSANNDDLQTYRNAVFWHDFWGFSGKKFLLFISASYDLFIGIVNKTDEIKYTKNDNPKKKIPQMLRNYNENMEAIINLLKRYPNA